MGIKQTEIFKDQNSTSDVMDNYDICSMAVTDSDIVNLVEINIEICKFCWNHMFCEL